MFAHEMLECFLKCSLPECTRSPINPWREFWVNDTAEEDQVIDGLNFPLTTRFYHLACAAKSGIR